MYGDFAIDNDGAMGNNNDASAVGGADFNHASIIHKQR